MAQNRTGKIRVVWTVVRLALLGLVLVAALNYQLILDRYALLTYHPTADVAAIVSRLGLTDQARAILYRANPRIDDKSAFNADCNPAQGELELGCFSNGRIYVLKIDNPSLAPEMDVVMAHELLHAAWVRLGQSERTRLSGELEQTYGGLGDAGLKERIASYAKTEPGQQANELHSILATEQPTLPSSLQVYYTKYFNDRAQIVAEHEAFEAVFSSRRQGLENELATIRQLKAELAGINAQLDYYRRTNQISKYNALVPRQNALVDQINGLIRVYQAGVDEYNALAKSIDSQQITETEGAAQ